MIKLRDPNRGIGRQPYFEVVRKTGNHNSEIYTRTERMPRVMKNAFVKFIANTDPNKPAFRFADFEVPEVKEQEQPEKANRNDSFKLD